MNEVSYDPTQVRDTGKNSFPDLADIHSKAAAMMTGSAEDGSVDFSIYTSLSVGPSPHERVTVALSKYAEQAHMFLSTSALHLRSCGETLVQMVDDNCDVDENNAYHLDSPSDGRDIPDNLK